MKSKWNLISSIIQLVVGILAIVAFIIMVMSREENMTRWIGTLILAILFVVFGIIGIIEYKTQK